MCDQKNGGDHGNDVDELSASDESEPEERPSSAPFDPELDDDDDDDHDGDSGELEISAPAAGHRAQSSFSLRGGSSAFSNRSHSIFDCLDGVARLASSSLNKEDGVFARPLPPRPSRKTSRPPSSCPTPAKKRGAPDYLVHPERWTHYSLEDVTETSDQGNSRAAHHFLSSLQQREERKESRTDSSCNIQQKMIFSRPSGLLKEQPADRGKEKETHLSHLEEDEEDEEDEEGRERGKAGGKITDQSVEKAEDRDTRGAVGRPEEKKQVQKEEEEEEEEEEEKEKEEKMKIEEANPGFTSFRKTKRKNYRKCSGREDN